MEPVHEELQLLFPLSGEFPTTSYSTYILASPDHRAHRASAVFCQLKRVVTQFAANILFADEAGFTL
jgi:hypothetical protein